MAPASVGSRVYTVHLPAQNTAIPSTQTHSYGLFLCS